MNPKATAAAINTMHACYPPAASEKASDGHTPLHILCMNPDTPSDLMTTMHSKDQFKSTHHLSSMLSPAGTMRNKAWVPPMDAGDSDEEEGEGGEEDAEVPADDADS